MKRKNSCSNCIHQGICKFEDEFPVEIDMAEWQKLESGEEFPIYYECMYFLSASWNSVTGSPPIYPVGNRCV